MSNSGLAVQDAMRAALLAHAPLITLLQGHHIHEEMPRGAKEPFVSFGDIETRDWSVADQRAHEHFVTLAVLTNQRSRKLAQDIVAEIETVLDAGNLVLTGHVLVNLRLVFWTVSRAKGGENFGAIMRFRAATEPL